MKLTRRGFIVKGFMAAVGALATGVKLPTDEEVREAGRQQWLEDLGVEDVASPSLNGLAKAEEFAADMELGIRRGSSMILDNVGLTVRMEPGWGEYEYMDAVMRKYHDTPKLYFDGENMWDEDGKSVDFSFDEEA